MTIAIIAAVTTNGVVGKNGGMPWHLPNDLSRFKKLTTGHSIVMGRRTWQSIGRSLPNRLNVILSSDLNFAAPGGTVVKDFRSALALCAMHSETTYVIGGTNIWRAGLAYAERAYITRIYQDIDGDAWFPSIDWTDWKEVERVSSSHLVNGQSTRVDFLVFNRSDPQKVTRSA